MATLSSINLKKKKKQEEPSLLERIDALEARIAVLERHGHDIPLETVDEIMVHTINHIRTCLTPVSPPPSPLPSPSPSPSQ